MFQALLNFLGAERYTAHSLCLTADPLIMTLYVISDGVTFISYFVIGLSLLFLPEATFLGLRRPGVRILFGSFIFLCGLSHLTMVLTLFSGIYRLDVMIRVMMAAVSGVTTFVTVSDLVNARR